MKILMVFVKAMFGRNSVILQSEFQSKLQTNYEQDSNINISNTDNDNSKRTVI